MFWRSTKDDSETQNLFVTTGHLPAHEPKSLCHWHRLVDGVASLVDAWASLFKQSVELTSRVVYYSPSPLIDPIEFEVCADAWTPKTRMKLSRLLRRETWQIIVS